MTAKPKNIYSVGTLRYTQSQLYIVFFWVLWNDFSVTLIESIQNLNGVLYKSHGATNIEMALFGSIGGLAGVWLNPVCSTWSDRLRTKYGRRRPFLFFSAPFLALTMMAIPFMPDFYHFLMRYPFAASLLGHITMSGPILFLGVAMIVNSIFNAVLLAIFSYLYWDVVPQSVLGRFNSLVKIIGLLAGLTWSFFIVGIADYNMKGVYVGVSVFCLVVYLFTTWRIKEGEYPPPDVHKKGGVLAPVRAYFVECFSDSYYIWIFVGMLAFQASNIGQGPRGFYYYYDLNLHFEVTGPLDGWGKLITTGFGLIFGFALGSMTDWLKPIRLLPYTLILSSILHVWGYFYVRDSWTILILTGIGGMFNFFYSVVFGAFQVEVFPREKIGQFCSAQAVFYQVIIAILVGPLCGLFFDYMKTYRLSFLWIALFQSLSGLVYLKVYYNWKKRHGRTVVPHAG